MFSDGLNSKGYTLGKGRVFIDLYPTSEVLGSTVGSGERFIGNAPEFAVSITEEGLDHYASTGGVKVKDDSVTLQVDRSGRIMVDSINKENLALYFMGSASSLTQTADTGVEYQVTVNRGVYYQIGRSETNPTGDRNISNVVVKKGAGFTTVVTASGNYAFDGDSGMLYIEAGSADIPDGTAIKVEYDVAASSREQIVSSNDVIYAALHYVADNPKGANRDVYYPLVKISPDGDYNLISDDWTSMSFTYQVLQKGTQAAVYVDGRGVAA